MAPNDNQTTDDQQQNLELASEGWMEKLLRLHLVISCLEPANLFVMPKFFIPNHRSCWLTHLERTRSATQGQYARLFARLGLPASLYLALKTFLAGSIVFLRASSIMEHSGGKRQLVELDHILGGDIYAAIPELGIFALMQTALIMIIFQSLRHLWIDMLTHSTHVRLFLNPSIERERLDQTIEWRLGAILGFVRERTRYAQYMLRSFSGRSNQRLYWRFLRQLQSALELGRGLFDKSDQMAHIRPQLYTVRGIKSLDSARFFLYTGTFIPMMVVIIAVPGLALMAQTPKCRPGAEPLDCIISSLFLKPGAMLLLLEETLLCLVNSLIWFGLLFIYQLQIVHQYQLTQWAHKALIGCRHGLCRQLDRQLLVGVSDSQANQRLLLDGLIRYQLFLDESTMTMRMLSIGSTVVLMSLMTLGPIVWLSRTVRDESLTDPVAIFALSSWFSVAMLQFACSKVSAIAATMKRQIWSMLANVAHQAHLSNDEGFINEPLFAMWHRLVISERFQSEWPNTIVLGTSINYHTTLKSNYFALSIALIINSRTR